FDPRASFDASNESAVILGQLVAETGGTLARGADLAGNLARASRECASVSVRTYEPAHGDDGKYRPVTVTVVRLEADARTRAGYVSQPSAEMRRAQEEGLQSGAAL